MPAPQQQRKLTGALSPSFRLRNSSLDVVRLRRIFDLFDRDSDGLITPSELSDALNRLGLSSDPSDVSSLLFPPGDSPSLDFPAFEALHRSLGDALQIGASEGDGGPHEEEEEMVEAFRVFDEDGDGFICAEELQAVLRKLGMEEEAWRSLDKVRVMIGSADCNKDGRVDFYEFKNMMRRTVVVVEG